MKKVALSEPEINPATLDSSTAKWRSFPEISKKYW